MKGNNALPFIRALLEKSSRKESLVTYFPSSIQEELEEREGVAFDISNALSPSGWANDMHYSWFFEPLKATPKSLQSAILSLLSESQTSGLASLLDISPPYPKVSHFASLFYLDFLKKKMLPKEIPPLEKLPYSELNILFDLDRKELIHLIDLLGIYDLAQDVRQIVDKELLEKIYSALSKDLLQFLQYCVKQPIKWISPKMNLQNWDGSKKQLNLIVHQRGLFRLARGIASENRYFHWHLFHRLDTGRAKVMESTLKQKYEPVQAPYFRKQILDLVKRYNK